LSFLNIIFLYVNYCIKFVNKLLFSLKFIFIILIIPFYVVAQNFPSLASLSTGQGVPGTYDATWEVNTQWLVVEPTNTLLLNYTDAYINNNCAPGAWVNPSQLPPPVNNGNWITSDDATCGNNTSGHRVFRLPLNLPSDCNGNPIASINNYILYFSGYVDNTITNVYVNGVPKNISGGSFTSGSQINFQLSGPWNSGVNFIDIVVLNYPGGGINPFGLLLVADTNQSSNSDIDNDGISDLLDLCPCQPGVAPSGCCPLAPTVIPNQSFCFGATIEDITISGQNINWYESLTSTISLPSNTPLQNGFTYYATQSALGCESERSPVQITIISPEINQTAAIQYFCQGGTVGELLPQGADIFWYSSLNSSLPLDSSNLLENNQIYFASRIIDDCESLERIEVKVYTNCEIPKGISPNGDGKNDTFDLSFLNGVELQIFNRYGMEMYSKSNYINEWNGKDFNNNTLPSGVYYYIVKKSNNEIKTGWVYLTAE
jgi:gliding motility-associated-like protein